MKKSKAESNRENAQLSTGPRNTRSTRFNARKHGLLSSGVTELDIDAGYCETLRNLRREKRPSGLIENWLVEAIALNMIRSRRARRLEAEQITAVLNPEIRKDNPLDEWVKDAFGVLVDPGLPATLSSEFVKSLLTTHQRYETLFMQRVFQCLHELERVQRIRRGEKIAAPAVGDLNVHIDPPGGNSVRDGVDEETVEGTFSEPSKLENLSSAATHDEEAVNSDLRSQDQDIASPVEPTDTNFFEHAEGNPSDEEPGYTAASDGV